MLFPRTSLLLALTSVVAAAPYAPESSTVEQRQPSRWWHSSERDDSFYDWRNRKGHSWHGRGYQQAAGSCDLASVEMPQAPIPLPPPSDGFQLYHVAVGRGTQNYTCDLANATAVPVAKGAVASLFNVTCLSADSPTLLSAIPNIALSLPTPSNIDSTSPIYQDLSGHHYFPDATTAYFNLDTTFSQYGAGGFKKINSTAAPTDAVKGQYGQGYGSVPWLKLTSKEAGCVFQEIYRINTAGGNPPKTCTGQQAEFQVEYSAEYWFYAPAEAASY